MAGTAESIVAPRPPRGVVGADNGGMLEPAERGTRARAVDTLKIASAVASYAARSLGNGLEPEEARRAALEAAADLEAAASALRRLARPDPVADPGAARRRALALELTAAGWPRQAIAERLGVTAETVRRYARVASGG